MFKFPTELESYPLIMDQAFKSPADLRVDYRFWTRPQGVYLSQVKIEQEQWINMEAITAARIAFAAALAAYADFPEDEDYAAFEAASQAAMAALFVLAAAEAASAEVIA